MQLLEEYRRYASEHGKHIKEADPDRSNVAHDNLHKTFLSLIAAGRGQDLILLFDDPDESVQLWAAAHSLEVDERKALEKLQAIADAASFVSLDAKYTIEEWRSGELRFLSREQ
jgi:Domain of unknown function (DUF2019)